MGKTNRDWYKHHPKAPQTNKALPKDGSDNFWRYREEEDPDGLLEGAKALEDRAQVSSAARKHADQMFEQMASANRLAADAEHSFATSASSISHLGEIDVGRLEQGLAGLPHGVRFNLDGALDRPMCPATFGAVARGGASWGGEDEDEGEEGEGEGGGGGGQAAAEGGQGDACVPDTTGDDDLDALLG